MVESITPKDQEKLLELLRPVWGHSADTIIYGHGQAEQLLVEVVDSLAQQGYQLSEHFDTDNFVASSVIKSTCFYEENFGRAANQWKF